MVRSSTSSSIWASGDGFEFSCYLLTVQFHAGIDVYMILAHSYMKTLHIVSLNCKPKRWIGPIGY